VSEGKPLRVLRTTSYLTLHKICVKRIRYFLKHISSKSSQLVNSQGVQGIIFYCVLQTVKDIRMGRTSAGMRKRVLIFCDITVLKPRTWQAKPVRKKIFINTLTIEMFIVSCLSDVMEILNNTGNVIYV